MPDADWSWDDLYRICKKVTKDLDGDGRLDQFGTYNYGWLEALYSNDGKIFDPQGKKMLSDIGEDGGVRSFYSEDQ